MFKEIEEFVSCYGDMIIHNAWEDQVVCDKNYIKEYLYSLLGDNDFWSSVSVIDYMVDNIDSSILYFINYINKAKKMFIKSTDEYFVYNTLDNLKSGSSEIESDPFCNDIIAANRLIKEWNEHLKIIVAFDFDGTVYDYLKQGSSHEKVIKLLKDIKDEAHIYCFSAREEEDFPYLLKQIKSKDIPCDGINIDYDFIRFKGRKPYYNILLDDRAGLKSAFDILEYAHKYKDEPVGPMNMIKHKMAIGDNICSDMSTLPLDTPVDSDIKDSVKYLINTTCINMEILSLCDEYNRVEVFFRFDKYVDVDQINVIMQWYNVINPNSKVYNYYMNEFDGEQNGVYSCENVEMVKDLYELLKKDFNVTYKVKG